jgi:hypothetical protein
VTGCRHATFVDVHHLLPRAEGGGHTSENLVTLCSAHHRAIHRGELLVDGGPSTSIRFRHADGTVYGGSLSAAIVDARARASRALELMGYRPSEVKRALLRVGDDRTTSLEQVIRQALQALAAPNPHNQRLGGGAIVNRSVNPPNPPRL